MAKHDSEDRLAGYTVLEGQWGTVRPEIRIAFPYFGETIRVHPHASDIEWTGFIDKMRQLPVEAADGMEALDETMKYIRGQIHPDDWELFWSTATANHQNSVDLVALCQDIVAAVANFPTGLPADSSPGRQPTDHLSKGGSSRRERRAGNDGKEAKRRRRAAATKRSLERANTLGRPDLALNILEAYENANGVTLTLDETEYKDVTGSRTA